MRLMEPEYPVAENLMNLSSIQSGLRYWLNTKMQGHMSTLPVYKVEREKGRTEVNELPVVVVAAPASSNN